MHKLARLSCDWLKCLLTAEEKPSSSSVRDSQYVILLLFSSFMSQLYASVVIVCINLFILMIFFNVVGMIRACILVRLSNVIWLAYLGVIPGRHTWRHTWHLGVLRMVFIKRTIGLTKCRDVLLVDRSKKQSNYPGRIEDYEPVSQQTLSSLSVCLYIFTFSLPVHCVKDGTVPTRPNNNNTLCSETKHPLTFSIIIPEFFGRFL